MVKVREDLTGKTFGRLTVLEQAEDYILDRGEHVAQWLCECSCSDKNKVIVSGYNLKKKNGTRSCGCLQKERAIEVNKKYNKYDLSGEYGIGWTSNTNEEFYFDLEDYDKIKNYCWSTTEDNGVKRIIARDPQTKKIIRMHTLLGYKNYDHIDKNELNNIKSNFRECTHQQNDFNRGLYKNNKSGITGVCWNNDACKWQSAITINGVSKYLGLFINKEDAIRVRLEAEKKYFKEFAPQKHLFEKYGIPQD